MQDDFTPDAVADDALALLEDPERRSGDARGNCERCGQSSESRARAGARREAVLAVARAGGAQRLG